VTLPVSNLAINGRSTRSYINEGRWATLLASTNAGDYVIIEMGHNDDGDPTAGDTYAPRATLPGIGNETVVVGGETVHTFGWYLRKMIADVQAKKAVPVLSGMVPRMYFKGDVLQKDWPFADYAKQVAAAAGVSYVDHTKYSVAKFQALGSTKALTYYPNDKTHTNPAGAIINSDAFAQAVKCGSSVLKPYLNSKGQSGSC
jgi:rhamnogalacturonan acetylesterase